MADPIEVDTTDIRLATCPTKANARMTALAAKALTDLFVMKQIPSGQHLHVTRRLAQALFDDAPANTPDLHTDALLDLFGRFWGSTYASKNRALTEAFDALVAVDTLTPDRAAQVQTPLVHVAQPRDIDGQQLAPHFAHFAPHPVQFAPTQFAPPQFAPQQFAPAPALQGNGAPAARPPAPPAPAKGVRPLFADGETASQTSEEDEEEESQEESEEEPELPPMKGALPGFRRPLDLQAVSSWRQKGTPAQLKEAMTEMYLRPVATDSFSFEMTEKLIALCVLWLENPRNTEVPQKAIDLMERTRIFFRYGAEAADEFEEELAKEECDPRYRKATKAALKKRKPVGSKKESNGAKEKRPSSGGNNSGKSYIPTAVYKTLTDEQKTLLRDARRK